MKTLLRKRFTWLVVLTALAVNTAMAQNHHTATPVEPGSKGNLPSMPARPAEAEPGYFGGLELDQQTMTGLIINGYYTYEAWLKFPEPSKYEAEYYTIQYCQSGSSEWKTWTDYENNAHQFTGNNAIPTLDLMETNYRLVIHGGPMDGYISNVITVSYPVVGKCKITSWPIPSENQLVGRPVSFNYLIVTRHDYPEGGQKKEFDLSDGCYIYSWYRRNPNTGDMILIKDAVGTEYTPTTEDVGYEIVAVVSGDDKKVSFKQTINFHLVQMPLECSVEYMDQTGFVLNSAYVLPNPEKDMLISEAWSEENLKPFAEGSLTTLNPGQYSVEMDKEKFDGALLGYSDNRIKVSFVYSQPKYDEEGYPIEGEYEPWYREAQLMYDRYMVPFTVDAMFNNELVSTTFDVIGKNRLGEIATIATVTPDELKDNVANFEVFQGKYYVRARKTEGTMETYYPNVQLWSEAKQIEPEPMSWEEDWKPTSVSIAMQAAPAPLTGIGVIEGTVVLNEPAAAGTRGDDEAETETCRVYLKAKDAEIIAQTETDANGKFRFENVPFGDYQVLLDVEGHAMKSVQEVAVTEDKPEVAELDYVITENEIVTKEEYIASITTEPIKIGKSGKASYCGDKSLDFSGSDEIKAYIATGFDKDEEIIWLTRVKDVPAGTPVLIKGEANQTYDVPVTDSENSYYTNMFKGNISGATVQVNETDGGMVNYYLSGDGTFKSVKGYVNIGNNKSYLQLPGTFNPAAAGATQTVKVGSAGKASYAAPVDLDFTNVEGLKAFTATGYDKSTKTIWLTRVMKVQKGEGVLLKGDAKDYEIPSTAVQSSYMNMFVGNTSGASVQVQATSTDGSKTNFYLKGDGTFVSVNGYVNIGNNKCYLELPTDMVAGTAFTRGAEANFILEEPEVIKLPISFRSLDNDGDGTTAIRETKQSKEDGAYYTLQGQRVQNPGKGLYIKNGKKVVIK